MSCLHCERPGYAKVCFDCRLEEKIRRESIPDSREKPITKKSRPNVRKIDDGKVS